MVHPYLRRRENPALVDYPSEELREVLEVTLGVPLFQEQAMKIAVVAAGFSPSEADKLRRAMATFRRVGTLPAFEQRFVGGMVERGYRSEERRVGKECVRMCRSGWGPYQSNKKTNNHL